jgi:hypothetical protein
VTYSPLSLVTNETSVARRRQDPEGKESPAIQEDRSVEQAYVRVRTAVVHPQPNVLHATPVYPRIVPGYTADDWRVVAALDRRVPEQGVRFDGSSLRDVAEAIAAQLDVPVRLDRKALEAEAIDIEEPSFTDSRTDVSYRVMLRGLLAACDLAFVVRDGGLTLTTSSAASETTFVAIYPLPTDRGPCELQDLIQSAIQPTTWDANGGLGVVRLSWHTNELLVSQTQEVHDELFDFMRTGFDRELQSPVVDQPGARPKSLRVHSIRDPKMLRELEASLVGLCNATLGTLADPSAKVSVIGGNLAVQSSSRPFQIYAAELIRAIEGIEVVTSQSVFPDESAALGTEGGFGGLIPTAGMGAGFGRHEGGFCWVAREVYGHSDPRWLRFRKWMLTAAPGWLQFGYATHGQSLAAWLRFRPVAKSVVRAAMDLAVEGF